MALRKILIANRGEIACRVMESCRGMDIGTVAVFSEADADAKHVEMADDAVAIGPAPAAQSYLNADAILRAAAETGAEAIHPGYGFLAEDPAFADAVETVGLVWIGPRPQTIADMGDKHQARRIAEAAGVPILPGSGPINAEDTATLARTAEAIGYPLLVKAAAGGGGIGMGLVEDPAELAAQVGKTAALAARNFANGTVYLERYITNARHVEVQVFGYGNGAGVHFFNRDCSVQRRFQKIIEEAPAPHIPPKVRDGMYDAAMNLVRSQRYRGAGTVEFIVDRDAETFYFLEMNTRIQVEHPVTEMITGIDLVRSQIELAGGTLEPAAQSEIEMHGAAIECRIYAERPEKNFLPSPGTLSRFQVPDAMDDLRIDTGLRQGDTITPHYDPLIAKVIVRGPDRGAAIDLMVPVLEHVDIAGPSTNLDFLDRVLRDPVFRLSLPTTQYVSAGSYLTIPSNR